MNLPKISIRDRLFSHAYSTSNWFKPTEFEWDFKNLNNDFVFLTDLNVFDVNNEEYKGLKKYVWLIESPVITPDSYKYVYNNSSSFDKIFTHSEILLKKSNAHLVPIGGCHLEEEEIGLKYEKTRLVSMMYSNKNSAIGHNLSHTIANRYSHLIDVMGSGVNGSHVKKIESCRDYAFSIVIENCKEGYYFTEKIIDCFLSGVVPIYWGTDHIGEFFKKEGFYTFNNLEELESLLSNPLNLVNFYNSHSSEIIDNYNTALKYKIGDDYLYESYKGIL
jgi:hypothetical protein